MPNIKPISDLRNYTEVLKEVESTRRVYLTRNGHGEYGILTMAEIDELDRYRAAYTLFYNDVIGLCKVATLEGEDGIIDQNYSLNAGRYGITYSFIHDGFAG